MPGRLPPFWDRSVVFFANLLSLFYGNEGGTESLRREVGRIESYGGRLYPIIDLIYKGGNNLLVLDKPPDAALADYFEHDLKLDLPDMAVLPYARYERFADQLQDHPGDLSEEYQRIAEHSAEWVDGFVTDGYITELAQSLGKSTLSGIDGSRRGNNKLELFRYLLDSGLPVFETEFAVDKGGIAAALAALKRKGFRGAVVKAQIGASGIGMEKLGVDDSPAGVPDYIFHEGPCLVQGWLAKGEGGVRALHSPSVQVFVHHEGVYLYDITEQILSEASIHQGNHAPPPYLKRLPGLGEELLRQGGVVGRWLYDRQYRGTASIDFVVVERDDGPTAMVCEVNARVTGATYPAVLARRFVPGGSWIMRNLMLERPMEGARILKEIDDEKCLYRPGDTHGVIPINFNFNPEDLIDKGQFLCVAEDAEGCMELMDEIEEALPLDWALDRD